MDALKENDLDRLKAIYKKWWEQNHDKPLDELIAGWNENSRPLIDQDYKWV